MWDIRRHVDHLARLEHKFLVATDHAHRAFFDNGDLVVGVVVRRHLVALVKTEMRHGNGCAVKGFAPGKWIQLLFCNIVPRLDFHGPILTCRVA